MDTEKIRSEIAQAEAAHESWKVKLRDAVATGNLPKPSADIRTDNQCAFGKWLYGLKSDVEISSNSAFGAVVSAHATFHQEAGNVAKMVESGHRDSAGKALNGLEFAMATRNLKKALAAWEATL